MVPRTVLTRSGPISLNTARPVNTVQPRTTVNNAGPMKNVINNAYSTARRPFNKITTANNSNFTKKVNTVKGTKVDTVRPKAVLNAVNGNKEILSGFPRKDNMYRFDLKNVFPQGGLTFLFAKATPDESNLWHRRRGHDTLPIAKHFKVFTEKLDSQKRTCMNQSNGNASTRKPMILRRKKLRIETIPGKDYILLPLSIQDPPFSSSSKDSPDSRFKPSGEVEKKDAEDLGNEDSEVPSTEKPKVNQEKDASVNNTNTINTVSPTINTAGIEDNAVDENIVYGCNDDLNMPELEEIVYSDDDEYVGAEAGINNLDTHIPVNPILTARIHKYHPVEQIIEDIYSAPQT
ncbi:hypothetical protein Tco_0024091 [Tanacetum coccineum]